MSQSHLRPIFFQKSLLKALIFLYMNEILSKSKLAPDTYKVTIRAPKIAQKRRPGQFVIVRATERGERIPLTIAGADPAHLSITLVFQALGQSTKTLAALAPGDNIPDIAGPLGRPTELGRYEHVVCMGGGLGIALINPIAEALKVTSEKLTGIISARSENLLILEDEMTGLCDTLHVATDDGSKGVKGFPTDILQDIIESGARPDAVYAVGPVPLMAAVSELTRPYGIKTIVSLNPIMVDGTGMCGGCRVSVGGETKFACVNGPEFDGHLVDFAELTRRLKQYNSKPEQRDLPQYKPAHTCDIAHTTLQKAKLEAAESSERPADIPRQPMPEQNAEDRIRNFDEVPRGLSPEQARAEARRCLQCKNPMCVDGCPVGVDIPRFIKLIEEGRYVESAGALKEDNALPAVCGRVCPQEVQCEDLCVLGRKGDPVAIGHLERFAADYEYEHDTTPKTECPQQKGDRVAIVGSGPAGLTAAGELARMGYEPVILEALHEPGGVLTYGIPQFRLPKEIVQREVDYVLSLGAVLKTNFIVGKTATIEELFAEGYMAVFVGSGAGLPIFVGTPGENLNGVLSANEYLTRVNLMRAYDRRHETPVMIRPRVAVLGGGNVAMDAARTARRLGGQEVTIVYRRSEKESPARKEETKHAKEEGINIRWLCNAVEILGDKQGWVRGLRCVDMQLGEPDESGRRRPYPVEDSEFEMPVDMVIVAFGNRPHPLVPQTTPGLKTTDRGTISAEAGTGETSLEGVFAGGDIVTGAATVIQAMGAGKDAAFAIDDYLKEKTNKTFSKPGVKTF